MADLGAKLRLLRAGMGWRHMPRAMATEDLATRGLREIYVEGSGPGIPPKQAVFPLGRLPWPAGRRFFEHLRDQPVST